jgi:hypothetical protein
LREWETLIPVVGLPFEGDTPGLG